MNSKFTQAKSELDRNYELLETLGTGAFSEVKKAIHKSTGQLFAMKIIDRKKCSGKEQMIQAEIDILKKVEHPHIIRLFDLYETEEKIYLVMELVTGGELFDSIVARGHYTEADAAVLIQKILLAVDYLHTQGIAHRDLKPENLLFYDKSDNAKIMVSDFGLSKIFNDEEAMKTACGTPGYVAPEVLRRQGYGKEVDLWSLGVIAYILLCGYPPFYSENNQELFQQIMRGEYEFDSPHWDAITASAKHFVKQLLVVDASKRFTAKQALAHSFITKNVKQTPVEPVVQPVVDVLQSPNLAQRVSQNLRTRGASVSRRRSVDVKPRSNLVTASHSPMPEPGSRRTSAQVTHPLAQIVVPQESTIMEEATLKSKSETTMQDHEVIDSGVGMNKPVEEFEFLRQLSQVNKLINEGSMVPAFAMLQEIDCPYKLRQLYEDMIFNGISSTSDDTLDGVKVYSDNPTEQYLDDLARLVKKTKPLSFRMQSSHLISTNAPTNTPASASQHTKFSNESLQSGNKKKPFVERIDEKVTKMMAYLTGGAK